MSQRLIKPGLAAALPWHPVWGHALAMTSDGTVIWPVAGGAPKDDDPPEGVGDDDADDDDEDKDDEDEGDEEEDDEEDKAKKKPVKGKKKDEDDDEETVPKWKHDRLDRRMRAADKRSSDLLAQVKDLTAKLAAGAKDVNPDLQKKIDALEPQVTKLTGDNASLRLQVAFLTTTVPGVKWTDAEAALKLVDLTDVDMDDDGKVDKRALKAALKQLAKDKPYLVAKDDADDEDEDDAKDQRSGAPMNGKRKGTKAAPDHKALAKRFPVLGNIRQS